MRVKGAISEIRSRIAPATNNDELPPYGRLGRLAFKLGARFIAPRAYEPPYRDKLIDT